ncbi:hypothetical protein ACLM5H_18975 [Fredinandcohnia humi]
MKKTQAFIGCFFIAVATFLYATKHITAAIISMNINRPEVNYYEGAFDLVGFGINFWIIASLLAGVLFLFFSLKNAITLQSGKKQSEVIIEQK